MSKTKKNIFIFILVFAVVLIGVYFLYSSIQPKTFCSAQKQCEKVLNKYQAELEQIALDSLQSDEKVSGHFKKYYYSSNLEQSNVSFSIDAQGFLGGQYWYLVYTKDGVFCGETESYLYKEPDGNNIERAEKIDDHWWFCWIDYDGTQLSYK